MPKNYRHIKSLEWCPEADLNHRHADFQTGLIGGKSTTCRSRRVKLPMENQSLTSNSSNPNDRHPGRAIVATCRADRYSRPTSLAANPRRSAHDGRGA